MTGLAADRRISARNNTMLNIFSRFAVGLIVLFAIPCSLGFTDPRDVFAINNLYTALGSPSLPGWIPNGGDPCVEAWQGVQCVNSNITAIVLNGANLGGQLGDKLDSFVSIITIDLSNNNIGGSIPENLPVTMRGFFLSANQFTGSIPSSLSGLTLLSDMSVNDNNLTGELPDAFQSLTGLINLDLSNNLLSGQLPPSMASLSSLTTLHVQDNQLSGTLGVLQDLPLKDLNIENNLFSGPVPEKLLSIPNFKKDGNPFNTTIAPSVSSSQSPPPPSPRSGAAVPDSVPTNSSDGPSAQESRPSGGKKSFSTIKIVGCVIAGMILVIVAVLLVVFCISKCQENKSKHDEFFQRQDERVYDRLEPKSNEQLIKQNKEARKASLEEALEEQKKKHAMDMTVAAIPKEASEKQNKEHRIDMTGTGAVVMPPPVERVTVKPKVPNENIMRIRSPENLNLPVEKVNVNPVIPAETVARTPPHENLNPSTSVTSFSVASLQQYTNSFSEENLIRDDRLGKAYLAELPNGKLLAVMKVDNVNSKIPVDEFLELVLSISELRHPNLVELLGYCAEFEQRLLVYNYSSTKSLHDVLHCEDDLKRRLSWNARLRLALGAAKALEYLHEGCQPPVVHQNFESANVLMDDELNVRVFGCGLAPLLSSNSVAQLSGRIRALYNYEAPEINESGSCTDRSDVYSFGIVMLELLTGRKPYDSSRPRAEQHLVRWASSQLHDINTLSKMVDPSITGKCPEKSLSRFADIISRCIQQGPEFRPPMSEVVQDLTLMVEESRRRANGESHRV